MKSRCLSVNCTGRSGLRFARLAQQVEHVARRLDLGQMQVLDLVGAVDLVERNEVSPAARSIFLFWLRFCTLACSVKLRLASRWRHLELVDRFAVFEQLEIGDFLRGRHAVLIGRSDRQLDVFQHGQRDGRAVDTDSPGRTTTSAFAPAEQRFAVDVDAGRQR